MIRCNLLTCLGTLLLTMAAALSTSANTPSVSVAPFGKMPDGRDVSLYTLMNARGMKAEITNYGGIIVRLYAPDRQGKLEDVVLGFDSLDGYLKSSPYFGALIGRVGNRMAHGRFTLDGKTYSLATNNSPGGLPCHLHGGNVGFDKVLWQAEPFIGHDLAGLRLTYLSPDGEEGYPGNLAVTVTYTLENDNSVKIKYVATTDQPTPVNLTQHSYFNLKGEGLGDILGHVLTIKASHMTPVNAGLIPTGAITPVKGTPFDFTSPQVIGDRVDASDQQIRFGGGYDHNWVIDRTTDGLEHVATVSEPVSGRTMEVWTKEPGIQFYCGNFLDGSAIGKRGNPYPFRSGLCLETQHHPDSANQPGFPSVILRPGETYSTETVYRFSAK